MIIVSQDKRKIINFNNIQTIELDNETNFQSILIFRESTIGMAGVCGLYIGHYESKERAKEVLREIYMAYSDWENLKAGQPEGTPKPIYKMPEE